MIPNTKDQVLVTGGIKAVGNFGISMDNAALIAGILRKGIYSDAILAVLREYSANAYDAHRSVGKGDIPIAVMLPTYDDPVLYIRDFGPGLSQEDMFAVYPWYGNSLKRNSNDQVGMLGIGSKSGFAYGDSFQITSWHGGMKRLYVAALDESDMGTLSLLHEEPCEEYETGILIQVDVKGRDIGKFESTAKDLFKYFVPLPMINTELPSKENRIAELTNGLLYSNYDVGYGNREWVAVMGCIPYAVDMTQIVDGDELPPEYLERISGVLFFDIGTVDISASREELRYTDNTKRAIKDKLTNLIDEFVTRTLNEIESTSGSFWDKRLKAQQFKRLGLVPPDVIKEFVQDILSLKDLPPSFRITLSKKKDVPTTIGVADSVRVILRDDTRSIGGYGLGSNDYIVRKWGKFSWDEVRRDLDGYIAARNMTGIPIVHISSLPWSPNKNNRGGVETPKPKYRVFKLIQASQYGAKSENWAALESHVPSPTDVFVVLERFDTNYNFYQLFRQHKEILEPLGEQMPTVYGYRSTEKKTISATSVVGIEYRNWVAKVLEEQFSKHLDSVEKMLWAGQFTNWHLPKLDWIDKHFEEGHPIYQFTHMTDSCDKEIAELGTRNSLLKLYSARDHEKYPDGSFATEKAEAALRKRYPLLYVNNQDLYQLWGGHSAEWLAYIDMIDTLDPLKEKENDTHPALHAV